MNYVVGVLLAAIAALAFLWQHERASVAEAKTQLANERTDYTRESNKALQTALDRNQQLTQQLAQEADHAQTQINHLDSVARDAELERHRLLQRVTGLQRAASDCSDLAAAADAGSRVTCSVAARMLADLYRGADERAQSISLYADRLRIAGMTCERSYDAVTTMKNTEDGK